MRHFPAPLCAALGAVLLFPAPGFPVEEEKDAEIPSLASTETKKLLAVEGETARVTGKVASTGKSKAGNQFLNFAASEFVAVTFGSDVSKFTEGEPADLYEGKNVAITGPIKVYKGIPEIVLSKPSMIELIDGSELVVPGPEPEPEAEEKEETAEAPEPEAEAEEPPAEKPSPKKAPPVDWRKYFPEK